MPALFRDHLSSDNASGANTRRQPISSATTITQQPLHPSTTTPPQTGGTGLTLNTAFSRSSTTLPWLFFPAALISRILASASLSASSWAALLPCVCYVHWISSVFIPTRGRAYLGLKLLELGLLLGAVRLNLLLGLVARFPHFLGAVWSWVSGGTAQGGISWGMGSWGRVAYILGLEGRHVSPYSGTEQEREMGDGGWTHTLLNDLGCLPLGLLRSLSAPIVSFHAIIARGGCRGRAVDVHRAGSGCPRSFGPTETQIVSSRYRAVVPPPRDGRRVGMGGAGTMMSALSGTDAVRYG